MFKSKNQRDILILIHQKLKYENFYWEVGYYALIIAGIVHFGFLWFFLFLKLYVLAAVNVVSVGIYWYCVFGIGLKTLESKDDGKIGWLVYVELVGHNVIATYYLGAEAGFQYYIYLLAILPFFISTYRMPVYLFRVVLAFVTAVFLDTSEFFHHSRVLSDSILVEWMYRMNVLVASGALVVLLFLYLMKEKRYHNKLLHRTLSQKVCLKDDVCRQSKK